MSLKVYSVKAEMGGVGNGKPVEKESYRKRQAKALKASGLF